MILSKPVKAHELAAMLERWSVGGIQSPQTDQPSASSSRPALEETIDLAVLEGFRDLQQEGGPDLIAQNQTLGRVVVCKHQSGLKTQAVP